MVLFKTFLTPEILPGWIKNENVNAGADYTLIGFIRLDTTYSEVYLKHIRFVYVYNDSQEGEIVRPMQMHLKWYDVSSTGFQPGVILQNTMNHSGPSDRLVFADNKSQDTPSYSTLVQLDYAHSTQYTSDEALDWLYYSMERNALIKVGNVSSLQFEVFFTDVNGRRIYKYIPNVEIEFELF
jgi:hypothetical protein